MAQTLLNIKDLSLSFINQTVLSDLSLSIIAGEIVAIVGANGCGKSTILNVINNIYNDNSTIFEEKQLKINGIIELKKNIGLVYLPQNLRLDWKAENKNDDDYHRLSKISRLNEKFKLDKAGDNINELSDGQLQKHAIIETLSSPADLFLLDEPSNYLDIDGMTALEDSLLEIKEESRSVILVTHDRSLTDNVADRTYYITHNGIFKCHGGYQQAWSLKSNVLEARTHRTEQLKNRIKNLQLDVRRRKGWSALKEKQKKGAGAGKPFIAKKSKKMAQRAAAVNKRIEAEIEKMKKEKVFEVKEINLSFPEYEVKHRDVFSIENLSFSYSDTDLLKEISLKAETSDKICLMGRNGSGKSTLLKLINKELEPKSGSVHLHPNMNLQYISQGLNNFFKHEKLLDNFIGLDDESKIRQYLGAVHLRRDKVTEKIGQFSYGELMRAAIVKCILEKAEFLILDEPTSHLDIESIEVLESLLNNFQGGYFIISHDRTFVSNVAEKLYLLDDNRIKLI